ncbi:hypothetical protein QWY93_06735 [Echinicola jeungdonensis]|uniref:YtxH-like protein n=1 Tax=Echinicola jeungdonensis TaxID=709343 RepID=A0ABV5J3W4_9BACT|nr:hypothetical protein [Echinicola jeungdonensis]MDN3669017.1 hypothetical protein [Echinicola jeungdonensis]
MTDLDLRQQAEDLEKELQQQLGFSSKEVGSYAKVGGAVLAGGLLSYGITRAIKGKKKDKTDDILRALEEKGLIDSRVLNKTKRKKASIMGGLGKRLFLVLLALGKEKLIEELKKRQAHGK